MVALPLGGAQRGQRGRQLLDRGLVEHLTDAPAELFVEDGATPRQCPLAVVGELQQRRATVGRIGPPPAVPTKPCANQTQEKTT
ncbi:hypothetical protein [Nocardioides astragali]|uniref:Uncharacterized protein n=1 Tax=Nocardioides astragali TaxID=1776736 RepID=A0ABW2N1G5_9ACTN|nr:hypothetical protein [Nocardioides astragali]